VPPLPEYPKAKPVTNSVGKCRWCGEKLFAQFGKLVSPTGIDCHASPKKYHEIKEGK
jgi:hypothetical protein